MNLCFEEFFHMFTCVFDDHAPSKKLPKKEKSLIEKPWIDNYLRQLMSVKGCLLYKIL